MLFFEPAVYLGAALFYAIEARDAHRHGHPWYWLAGLAALHLAMAVKKAAALL
jgi:hypothetical protein